MHFTDCFPGVLVRGNDSNLSVWMRQQNPQQFRTAVARAAENCNLKFHLLYVVSTGSDSDRVLFTRGITPSLLLRVLTSSCF